MKALALTLLLLFATTSVASAGNYEDWFKAIGAARLGEYNPAFGKASEFTPYKTALEALLRDRLSRDATVAKAHRSKWWGRVGERSISVWGEAFTVRSGEFWTEVHRFELQSESEALDLALHVQHSTASVVQVRGKRLLVTESYWRTDMSQDTNRAQAVMTSLWDAWKGSPGGALRATILVSLKDGEAEFSGEIHVPSGNRALAAQAQAFLAKAGKHPNTKTSKQAAEGGTQFRYASWVSLLRNASAIAARTLPSVGITGTLRGE